METIDLAEFIKTNFTESDYIILKINCEGCEYEIIPHLQKNGLIDWVNKWYIQWHYEKIRLNTAEHDRIRGMIPISYEWDCQCNEATFADKFKATL